MINPEKIILGANNLLINCAELTVDDTVLFIQEDEKLGWYKNDVTDALMLEAKNKGIKTKLIEVGEPDNLDRSEIIKAINDYSCTIFFARLGDQDRFEKNNYSSKRVMSYVRSAENLASSFGTFNYKTNVEFKNAVDEIFNEAKKITIRCPLGTKLEGYVYHDDQNVSDEVSVLRFPLLVPKPTECSTFSGTVVIDNYLTSTGSKVYKPNFLKVNKPVFFHIEQGRIFDMEGQIEDVDNIKQHYKRVSEKFNLDSDCVHSWHAGLHPGTYYKKSISDDPDQWSNTMFGNPNFLHFHTCGNYAPGEICWMLEKPTITVDEVSLWDNGTLKPMNFKKTSQIVKNNREIRQIYGNMY